MEPLDAHIFSMNFDNKCLVCDMDGDCMSCFVETAIANHIAECEREGRKPFTADPNIVMVDYIDILQ